MHVDNIESLHNEAQRLLMLMLSNLEGIKGNPEALLDDASQNTSLKFNLAGVVQQIDTLQDELDKLTHQEMVLAVVGTMKSGKSTTINAIVGTEVLPNRNRPMTALPTLIRHTKGQIEPVLHFTHAQPINILLQQLTDCIDDVGAQQRIRELDSDMFELLTHIRQAPPFAEHYQGAELIFNCLKNLNDMVRLSHALDIDFPFGEYAVVKHIPVIDVEFAHLSELPAGQGQLTLLDTPGPNEAGQAHLETMLKDQLGKASAVLTVMDYTQLKSTSDEEVRQAISVVGKDVPVYALVNKFDQQGMHGDDGEKTKKLVADHLMKNIVSTEQVFPVSSQLAYLANRIRHEIQLNGVVPAIEAQPWVADFTRIAMPFCEADDLLDTPAVLKIAEKLWKRSLFSAPLTKIIQTVHANASLYALKSASNKLSSHAREAEEYFTLRAQGLVTDIETLNKSIGELESDITQLTVHQHDVENTITLAMDNANRVFTAAIETLTNKVTEEIEAYFKEGKREERVRNDTKNKQPARKPKDGDTRKNASESMTGLVFGIFGQRETSERHKTVDFNPDENRIEFENRDEAKKLLNTIHHVVDGILDDSKNTIADKLNTTILALEATLTTSITECTQYIEAKTQGSLERAGFNVKITFPTFNHRALNFSIGAIDKNDIREEEKAVTRQRRQDGLWGSICGWCDSDDWGWEDYDTTETVYALTLSKIKSDIKKNMATVSHTIQGIIGEHIQQPIQREMEAFFAEFSRSLEGIRANLHQSRLAQQQETQGVEQLKKQLDALLTTSHYLRQDSNDLQKEVHDCFSTGQVPA